MPNPPRHALVWQRRESGTGQYHRSAHRKTFQYRGARSRLQMRSGVSPCPNRIGTAEELLLIGSNGLILGEHLLLLPNNKRFEKTSIECAQITKNDGEIGHRGEYAIGYEGLPEALERRRPHIPILDQAQSEYAKLEQPQFHDDIGDVFKK